MHPRLSEPRLSDPRLSERAKRPITSLNTYLRMCNLPTFVGVADFRTVRSSRRCFGPIAAASFTEAMTKSKLKRKALSEINDKVSIVKQLKSRSVAIIAERYGLYIRMLCLTYVFGPVS